MIKGLERYLILQNNWKALLYRPTKLRKEKVRLEKLTPSPLKLYKTRMASYWSRQSLQWLRR